MAKLKAKHSESLKSKKNKSLGKKPKDVYSPEQLKSHHAKPFRKRHYGLLIGSLISAVVLVFIFTSTSVANHKAVKDAKSLISNTLSFGSPKADSTSSVASSYGFGLDYNQNLLYATGLDTTNNKLYVGTELATVRGYGAIRIGQSISDTASAATSGSMGIEYHYRSPVGTSADLAKLEAQLVGSQHKNFTITKSSSPTISNEVFLKSEWVSKPSEGVGSSLQGKITSYVGVVNGAPLTIVIDYGLSENSAIKNALDSVVGSLRFGTPAQIVSTSLVPPESKESSLTLLDRLTFTGRASAAQPAAPSSSEKISTIYGPAVVKIYNIYCMDVTLSGQLFIQNSCSGATGSGFFVGNQGHVATNGHVAVNNPLDMAILFVFDQLSKGDSTYFSALAEAANLTQADLDAGTTDNEQIAIAIKKFYSIPDSVIGSTNKVENILVGLGEKQPDIQKLINMTKARELYPEEDTIKQAKLVAYDYRAVDGAVTGGFKASDVALLKVEGSSYPSAKIGNISSLSQGSGISIIGYPGAASSNELVESTESKATLTSGKVSSIKSATGSNSQLIETDATIGHGNSGGPAFNDAGEVVGIATYTIDGSGEGNGVFNYVRDIADLSSLASKNSVDPAAANQTQTKWQQGVDYFYQAKYSKAIKEFAAVKALYPQHPKADQLSALAKQKIDAGEEVKDFPVLIVGIAAGVALVLVVVAIVLIVRHRKKHAAYQEHIQAGTINSLQPQAPVASLSEQPVAEQYVAQAPVQAPPVEREDPVYSQPTVQSVSNQPSTTNPDQNNQTPPPPTV